MLEAEIGNGTAAVTRNSSGPSPISGIVVVVIRVGCVIQTRARCSRARCGFRDKSPTYNTHTSTNALGLSGQPTVTAVFRAAGPASGVPA